MAGVFVNVRPTNNPPLSERFVQAVEEMSPAIPLVACVMWGILLVLLSFAFNVAMFQFGSKSFGWIHELNWSSTFAFFIPFSLFFSCATLTAVPQVITTLAKGQMIRDTNGQPCDPAALIAIWRRRAGKTARLAAVIAVIGFIVSWGMAWKYCILSNSYQHQIEVPSWQVATALGAPGANRLGVAIFGFLAFTSQGVAIASFCYYVLIIFTFANWIHDYTKFDEGPALYPDIAQMDPRYGFERFGPVIEDILLASLAYFFQFFMTRLFYIYVDDPHASSMVEIITRTIGNGFVHDIGALVKKADPSLFDFGSSLHFSNTLMCFAMLIVVISATVVPMVIVREAASRSRVRLQEAIQVNPSVARDWYGVEAAEAQARLDNMTFWPIRYAKPMELLLLIFLATACFFAYKLFLLLVGFILYRGLRQFMGSFEPPARISKARNI
jgi:hypothetical protein